MLRPGGRRRRRSRRPPRVHGLVGSRAHRLGRLPGLLAEPKVDDDGRHVQVHLRRHDAPADTRRTRSRIQESLGADIQMALDVCPPLPPPTTSCARPPIAPTRGRSGPGPRSSPARATARPRPRPGPVRHLPGRRRPPSPGREREGDRVDRVRRYAIGGLSVGEPGTSRSRRWPPRWSTSRPTSRATSWGWVTRSASSRRSGWGSTCSTACCRRALARHGTVLTSEGRYHLKGARFETDERPLDEACGCLVCHAGAAATSGTSSGRRARRPPPADLAQRRLDPGPRGPTPRRGPRRHLRLVPRRGQVGLGLTAPL